MALPNRTDGDYRPADGHAAYAVRAGPSDERLLSAADVDPDTDRVLDDRVRQLRRPGSDDQRVQKWEQLHLSVHSFNRVTHVEFQVTRVEGFLLLGYQILVNVINVMGLVVTCSLLKGSVRRTADIAHKVMIVSTSNAIRDRVCINDKCWN